MILTVWFGGGCPLCRREIAVMKRLARPGAIRFLDVGAGEAPEAGDCPIDRGALLARFHAMEEGRVVSGAAAFAAMRRAIPRLRPLGLTARNPVVLAGLERLCIAFLHVRPRLQRLPWALGADFFLRHLVDADPASNTLSWRWVAGLRTPGKTYRARADTIARHIFGRFSPPGLAEGAPALTDEPLGGARALPRSEPAADGPAPLLMHPENRPPFTS